MANTRSQAAGTPDGVEGSLGTGDANGSVSDGDSALGPEGESSSDTGEASSSSSSSMISMSRIRTGSSTAQ